MNNKELQITATKVRKGIVEAVHSAKSGHPGGSLSAADMFTFLYFEEMNIDPKNPKDPNRDRFVLSKGHTAPGLYSTLANRGFFPVEDLKTLRKLGSYLQGHPCMTETPGVDMSTGSLGQGVSAAVGMALAAKLNGDSYRVYALTGDGEIQEGQIWEDDVCSPYPIDKKLEAFNFNTICIDGHDFNQIRDAFAKAKECKGKPTAIIMKTTKGKGVSYMENQAGWHGKAPSDEEYEQAMKELDEQLAKYEAEV